MRDACKNSERGASLIESVVCLVTLVLSGLAVFEIAQWHITRHLAQLALHAAGRAGAVSNANPQAIRATAAAALAPRIAARAGLRSWRIEILSPTATMFSDFSDAQLSREERRATIRNDFLAEQHASHQARGWANGIGPASGKDIFHANTLRLRLTVLYAPVSRNACYRDRSRHRNSLASGLVGRALGGS